MDELLIGAPPALATDYSGFNWLAATAQQMRLEPGITVVLRMSRCRWIDGNLCAPLFVAVATCLQDGGRVELEGICREIGNHWRRNGFGTVLDLPPLQDSYRSTIPFRRFGPDDHRATHNYLAEHFVSGAHGLPAMTQRLLSCLRSQLCEIFSNAYQHGEAAYGVCSCGQQFPTKRIFRYTIADTGIGFRERIRRSLGHHLSAADAVAWAVAGNSTKSGDRPGGCGLQLLQEFARLNQGRLVIVSDEAYWECDPAGPRAYTLSAPFPGTAVTLELHTDDPALYDLREGADDPG